jgi:hypothetical protein
MKVLLEQIRSDCCSFLAFRCDCAMARTFCRQLQLLHETSDPFSRAMNPLRMQFCMDTWTPTCTPIDTSIALERAFDLVGKLSIFSTMQAGFTFVPGVVATDGNLKHMTHGGDRIFLVMLSDELELHS